MVRKPIVLAVVLVLVLGAAGAAFAGARGFGIGRGYDPEAISEKVEMIRGLELTDEQVDEIQALLQQRFTVMQQWREQIARTTMELRQLMWQRNPDQTAIEAKVRELTQLREQMREQHQDGNTIHGVLTEEQRSLMQQGGRGLGLGPRGQEPGEGTRFGGMRMRGGKGGSRGN